MSICGRRGIKLIFAVPGIVVATVQQTFPFISREIILVLSTLGTDEEEAAALMGANGFTIFSENYLPTYQWALLYGIVLCTARAMGEFGAVSVLSGHLQGKQIRCRFTLNFCIRDMILPERLRYRRS